MSFILFALIFLYTVNRYWIRAFIEGFTTGKPTSTDIKDEKILDLVKNKTGLKLSKIRLMDTDKVWGMMAGMPPKPYMVISKDAYENMARDELQWVILHEAGHWVLGHNIKMALLQAVFVLVGLFILQNNTYISPLILAPMLGVLLAIIHTQIARLFEYQANGFALARMDNPKGLENILERAKERWRKKRRSDGLKEKLFNVWILDIYKDLVSKATRTQY